MADVGKILAQVIPAATTLTTLYTVPAATTTFASTFCVCNQAGSAATYRVSVAVAGAADATKQYIAYDAPLRANETMSFTIGLALATTDVVRCYSSNGQVSFNLFGIET